MTRLHELASATLVFLLVATAGARSQLSDAGNTRKPVSDTVQVLQKELAQSREERQSMERMVAALNAVDSVYRAYFPMWVVLDEDLRQRVFKSFDARFSQVRRDTEVVVVGSPDRSQILEIDIGPQAMRKRDVAINLSDSLYQDLLAVNYPLREFTPSGPKQKTRPRFDNLPAFAAVSASAFGAMLLFSNGMGIEAKLGREELGYHFWSSGDIRVMGIYNRFKLGLNFPIPWGLGEADRIPSPIAIRPRKMMGARGVVMEYEYQLPDQSLGGHLSVCENNGATGRTALYVTAGDSARNAYVHTVAQAWYSRRLKFGNENEHMIALTGGVGYHQITTGMSFLSGLRTLTVDKQDFVGPMLRVNYSHEGENSFGLNVQYDNSVIFVHGWLEFVKNILYVDIKYYSPVVRDPKPWEQNYFFMVSPRFEIVY